MRLLKKPIKKEEPIKEEPKVEPKKESVKVPTQRMVELNYDEQRKRREALGITGDRGKPLYNDYKRQSVDGFVARVKLCIGKPDLTDGSKRLFGSKVNGVFYDVYANVCKTPKAGVVVGVKIVDPIYYSEYHIDGSKFEKEEGLLNFFEWTHRRQFFSGDIGDGIECPRKSKK